MLTPKFNVGDQVTWELGSSYSRRPNRVLALKTVIVSTGKGTTVQQFVGIDNNGVPLWEWERNPYWWIPEDNCQLWEDDPAQFPS